MNESEKKKGKGKVKVKDRKNPLFKNALTFHIHVLYEGNVMRVCVGVNYDYGV